MVLRLLGILLLVANHRGGPSTVLGFYLFSDFEMIGYSMVTMVISALAIWMVARGFSVRNWIADRCHFTFRSGQKGSDGSS
jgi:hypothetical protein